MHVGGSKGSISGNYAMQNARLLISIDLDLYANQIVQELVTLMLKL